MKRLYVSMAVGLLLLALGSIFVVGGCSRPKDEGFAIYLTAHDTLPSDMPALSSYDLADKPLIAMSDIVSYNSSTHEITLTDSAYKRVNDMKIPTRGTSFVACVDKQPIYWGAFWTPISSQSFSGVTIWQWLGSDGNNTIQLKLGYPSDSFYNATDPRGNTEIMQALRQAGKLTGAAALADRLPKSMKGYELYSCQQDEEWHFTLITGTNRNKTDEEILSPSNSVTADGWVQIQVIGVDAIRTVIGRIPAGEWVSWMTSPPGGADMIFMHPDDDTVAQISAYAKQCGLNFNAT